MHSFNWNMTDTSRWLAYGRSVVDESDLSDTNAREMNPSGSIPTMQSEDYVKKPVVSYSLGSKRAIH